MIRRFYVHNFRCLENFELPIVGLSSALLIGKNGSGKTAVAMALEVLQKVARTTSLARDLVRWQDLFQGRSGAPMRFEIEVELSSNRYEYALAFEFPEGHDVSVLEERLSVDGVPFYTRDREQIRLFGIGGGGKTEFRMDSRATAFPLLMGPSLFKQWLARMVILRPVPSLITGDSRERTLEPSPQALDFGAWFTGVLSYAPAAYTRVDEYLKQIMPDLKDLQNPETGKDSRSLLAQFSNEQGTLKVPFANLSDGEKCFMICALLLAANEAYGPLFCFWDEPDNYLALDEVGHFVIALRRAFQSGGQFIATSHNPEAIRSFSDENTLVLQRRSHLEPTIVRKLSDLHVNGDLVGALIRGDLGNE